MSEIDEAGHVSHAAGGDQTAFERLIARWEGEALNLAYRLTGNLEDARDIRQAAFIKAYEGLPDFDGRSRFSTWLFRIVVNLCRDHQRRQQSARRRQRAATAAVETDHEGPQRRAQQSELGILVAQAVGGLPPSEREVLVLRHYHGLACAEVARILDLPVTTARSRLTRALTRLRERLEPGPPESGPPESGPPEPSERAQPPNRLESPQAPERRQRGPSDELRSNEIPADRSALQRAR